MKSAVHPLGSPRREWVRGRRFDLALLLFVIGSRSWLLDSGFGWDADAWQLANSGYWLAHGHEHIVSRRPGYPLDEWLAALFQLVERAVHGPGWVVTNACTIFVFALQCMLLYRLARRSGSVCAWLLVAAYSLHPVVFDQSVGSLDVHLPLLLVLWTVELLETGRWVRASVVFGFAMAGRATTGVFFIPFLWHLLRRRSDRRKALAFAMLSLGLALPFYVDIWLKYWGASLPLHTPENWVKAWFNIGLYRTVGFAAGIALLWTVWVGRRKLWDALVRPLDSRDRFLALCAAANLAFFLVKPYDSAYLVPAMPFILVLLARHASTRVMAIFLIVLTLNGLVTVPGVRRDASGRAVGLVAWAPGEMFERGKERWLKRRLPQTLAGLELEPHTALVVGGRGSALWFHERAQLLMGQRFEPVGGGVALFTKPLYDRERDIYYLAGWNSDLAVELVRKDYVVRVLPGVKPEDWGEIRAAVSRATDTR